MKKYLITLITLLCLSTLSQGQNDAIGQYKRSTGAILQYPPVGRDKTSSILQVSFYPYESIKLSAKGTSIMIENLPESSQWNFVMLSLNSATGTNFNQEVYNRNQTVIYSIGHMPDGYYYVNLYNSSLPCT